MKSKITIIFSLLTLATFTIVGCSKFSQPSDAEVSKSIEDSGILKSKFFTVASPLVIVAREKQAQDGSWPVKVKMTLTIRTADGKVSEPKENTALFLIFKSKDATGNMVWKARLGS